MKNSEKISPLLSLADGFEHTTSRVMEFEELGDAPMGAYHVVVFFRNVVKAALTIDYENEVRPTRFCSVYNIVNARGSIYGILFSADKTRLQIKDNRLIVRGGDLAGDFVAYPYSNEKLSLAMYKDSSDTLLVNLSTVTSKLVVLDD